MNSSPQQRAFLYMKLAATILIVILLGALYFQSNHQKQQVASSDRSFISDLSPVSARPPLPIEFFSTLDLTSGEIKKIRLTELNGKVLHMVFWASWCEPCRTELPVIEKIIKKEAQLKTPSPYQVLLINVDDEPEGIKKAKAMQKLLVPSALAVFNDTANIEKIFDVEALPFHVIVDSKGRIATEFYNTIDERKKLDQFYSLIHFLRNEI